MSRAEQNKLEQKRLTKSVRSFVSMNLFQNPVSERHCDPKSSLGRRAWFAFTLAEVLIVLGLIGIVAEMTIPTLMNNVETQIFKTAYKKAYSVANQAIMSASTDDLLVERVAWVDAAVNRANFNAFKSKFKVVKSCDTDISQCWDITAEKAYGIPADNSTPGFVDASGFAWIATYEGGGFTGGLVVDTNGLKKPNQYGKDRFLLADVPSSTPCTGQGIADDNGLGLPVKVCPWGGGGGCDFASGDCIAPSGPCPSGKCYYTSWLYK